MQKSIVLMIAMLAIALQVQSQNRINGEGDIVKQEIQLETITGVALGFSGDVILTQGSTQKIVLEGQKNVLDNIKREVRSGTWQINYDKNVRNAKKVTIYITLATLQKAGVSGSGSIRATNHFSGLNDLELWVSGSGEIYLDISAGEVDASISGSGDISLEGDAKRLELAISGSGDVAAEDLSVGDCEIAISGSGDAVVNVNGSLEVSIAGSGDVRYKGNATRVRSSVSGSGDVESID